MSQSSSPLKVTWEKGVEDFVRSTIANRPMTKQPFMLCVVGIPGSGKTTSARLLTEALSDIGCMLMPFDGYHYPKAVLESFPNAADAIYRRGAPDTFDLESLLKDLHAIRNGNEDIVYLPGFDHARGDPEDHAHEFHRDKHKVVVCEGLYLLHDEGGWDRVADFFDFKVFVDANIDKCMERLKVRNLVIPGYTAEEINVRVDAVDRVNALTVQRSKHRANLVVSSVAI